MCWCARTKPSLCNGPQRMDHTFNVIFQWYYRKKTQQQQHKNAIKLPSSYCDRIQISHLFFRHLWFPTIKQLNKIHNLYGVFIRVFWLLLLPVFFIANPFFSRLIHLILFQSIWMELNILLPFWNSTIMMVLITFANPVHGKARSRIEIYDRIMKIQFTLNTKWVKRHLSHYQRWWNLCFFFCSNLDDTAIQHNGILFSALWIMNDWSYISISQDEGKENTF